MILVMSTDRPSVRLLGRIAGVGMTPVCRLAKCPQSTQDRLSFGPWLGTGENLGHWSGQAPRLQVQAPVKDLGASLSIATLSGSASYWRERSSTPGEGFSVDGGESVVGWSTWSEIFTPEFPRTFWTNIMINVVRFFDWHGLSDFV
jgi:hypothetical protein